MKRNININPARIHKYQRLMNPQNPEAVGALETAAVAAGAGLKFMERESV